MGNDAMIELREKEKNRMKARYAWRYLCCALIAGVLGFVFGLVLYLLIQILFPNAMFTSMVPWMPVALRFGAWSFLLCLIGPVCKLFRGGTWFISLVVLVGVFCLGEISHLLVRVGGTELYAFILFFTGYFLAGLLKVPFDGCVGILERR